MKRNQIKLLLIILLCAAFAFGCTSNRPAVPARTSHVDATQGFLPAASENELVFISENERLALYANLKNAIAQNAALKARAAEDIEFAKFAEDADFQAIVK